MMTPSGHPGTGRTVPGRNAARIALVLGAAAVGTTLLASPASASTPTPVTATAAAATAAVDAVAAADSIAAASTLAESTATASTATASAAAQNAGVATGPATATTGLAPLSAPAAVAKTAPLTKVTVKQVAQVQTRAQKVIALARQYSGRAYRWGAAGPSAFDCTGFTRYIYKKVGVSLPHSGAQGVKGRKVARSSARPGDLVVFRDSSGRVFHAGIYAGGNKMYDAPTYGKKTGLHNIWSSRVEFRRLV
ncbi:C40 family peptidase [Hamadaea tsunoensis]|uniref:C40 family peptidase n=1 Tax=Hamadaea tsunoensis TaxID=53368 RepID=UPI00040748CD|nr:C40 family peptidase [Hamadaea tsunoensis]